MDIMSPMYKPIRKVGVSSPAPALIIKTKKKKKKKKKKYSAGMKDIGKMTSGSLKSQKRMQKANSAFLNTFAKASNKSARKKRDGAQRDQLRNLGKAMRKQNKQSGKVLPDLLDTIGGSRAFRRMNRAPRRRDIMRMW